MRQNFMKWLLLAALLSLHTTGFADEVRMKNGDRITGNIVKLKDGLLTIRTAYAGILAIRWKDVKALQTDNAVTILLKDKRLFNTMLQDAQAMDLSDVTAINPDPPLSEILYSGRINAGVSISDGNTEKSAFSSDGELVARTLQDRWTLGWRINQEKTEGKKTADRESGYVKYDYFMTKKWYALVNVAAERDAINDLDLRLDSGVGTGYQFIDTKTDKLSAEVGVSQVIEDFSQATDPKYLAQRWAVNATFLLGRTGTEFFHQHNGLLSLENIDNLIIRSVTGLRMPIYGRLTSSIQVRWDWENNPVDDLRNSDVDYILLLGYQF